MPYPRENQEELWDARSICYRQPLPRSIPRVTDLTGETVLGNRFGNPLPIHNQEKPQTINLVSVSAAHTNTTVGFGVKFGPNMCICEHVARLATNQLRRQTDSH